MLNEYLLKKFKSYFKDDFQKFLNELDKKEVKAFCINTLKGDDILKDLDFEYSKAEYAKDCFYYDFDKIGKHYSYHLGLLYPKDVSSSSVCDILNVKKGSVVLDMCSAPGGKAFQLAKSLSETGFLILNEINLKRAIQEISNIEKMGFANYILFNEKSENIAKEFKNKVDYCLVDAPCSGEGMMRKYKDIVNELNDEYYLSCHKRQLEILDDAYDCLKGGGYICYSTCTYNPLENEKTIQEFLKKHKDVHEVAFEHPHNKYAFKGYDLDPYSCRRFSIIDNCEGQFVCLMKKDCVRSDNSLFDYYKNEKNEIVDKFIKDNLNIDNYYLKKDKDNFYLSFKPFIKTNLKVVRQGILLGNLKSKNFIPHHHLYRCNLLKKYFKKRISLNYEQFLLYVKGQELKIDNLEKGYYLIEYKGYSLGYGKVSDGKLKNKYPKGLRNNV